MTNLPKWVIKSIFRRAPAEILAINLAAIHAQLGYQDSLAEQGDRRGIPLNPPRWVRAKTWQDFAELCPTRREVEAVDDFVFCAVKAYREAERRRQSEAAKKCEHIWNVVDGVATAACIKGCGALTEARNVRKPILAYDRDAETSDLPDGPHEERPSAEACDPSHRDDTGSGNGLEA